MLFTVPNTSRQSGGSTFWYVIHCGQYLQTVWWFHLLVCYSLRPIPPDSLVVPPSGMLFTAPNTSRRSGGSTIWYSKYCAQYLQTVWWFHLLVCYSLCPIPPDSLVVPPSGMLNTVPNTSRQSGGSTFWYVIHCGQYLQTVWWFHLLVCYSLRPIPPDGLVVPPSGMLFTAANTSCNQCYLSQA
ncbi:hypothetical protein RRG08_054138 [Elysia crispata]|uniref:Uncharacterized protein n=1 Tax=Elysia crispata TaxID=231223 RepID=A0AAE0Y7C2_9GAST|nr:hypothetical protein RRG08_054138 [Elysia crispata]